MSVKWRASRRELHGDWHYTNVDGDNRGYYRHRIQGDVAGALAMTMPAGAATNPHTFFYGYGGLSCPSIGNCSAGGSTSSAPAATKASSSTR